MKMQDDLYGREELYSREHYLKSATKPELYGAVITRARYSSAMYVLRRDMHMKARDIVSHQHK